MTQDGSEPMRDRLERYAVCLAEERGNQIQCWCATADGGPVPHTKGREVSAVRAAKKVADRVLFLKAEIAKAKGPSEPLDPEQIGNLMRDIGTVLLNAARTVAGHGHEKLGGTLRKSAITHCGRSLRTAEFVEEKPKRREFDIDAALSRIPVCECG